MKKSKLTPCEKCPLYPRKATDFEMYEACSNSKVLFIHQEPDYVDHVDLEMPFKEPWDITRAVKCWKGEEAHLPVAAISLCREAYLDGEIERFTGEKIVLVGPTAVHSILKKKRKIRELLGHPFWVNSVVGKVPKLAMAVWDVAHYLATKDKQVLVDIKRAINWGFNKEIV